MPGLSGKVVVITGSSRGIGKAAAQAIAGEGAQVVLVARNAERLESTLAEIREGGGQAIAIPTDVTQADQVEALFAEVIQRFGRVDALVNNAGSSVFAPITESTVEDWDTTLAVNLTATYLCTRAVLPTMLAQKSGQIVNLLSIAAKVAFPGASAYCAAKAGALAFTKVIAEEVRDQGIRVTALCPGSVATPFWDTIEGGPDVTLMQQPEDVAEAIRWVLTQPQGIVVDEIITTPPLGIL